MFHCFSACSRLTPIFSLLAQFFTAFNLNFNITVFIFGNGYRKKTKRIDQIVNFLVGQAKLAIYKTRKNRVQREGSDDVLSMFKILVKCRLKVDYEFYKLLKDLGKFEELWCVNEMLCELEGVNLQINF